MLEAVFISDLHLHPKATAINDRFWDFLRWASKETHAVYILGDLFHACSGDEADDPWAMKQLQGLSWLASKNVAVYFMPGNRDFLLKRSLLERMNVTYLTDETPIVLDGHRVFLVHGDKYCTKDKQHQQLRWLTRNRFFPWIFAKLPKSFRHKLVHDVRNYSENKGRMSTANLYLDEGLISNDAKINNAEVLIHGHIHRKGEHIYENFTRFVLSDWDDFPWLLCYDQTKGFFLKQFSDCEASHE